MLAMMKPMLLGVGLLLAACTNLPTPTARLDLADRLAARQGWQRVLIPSGAFELVAYVPGTHKTGDALTVYVEGDGLAWISPSHPSLDPTPNNPIGLKLALVNPEGNAAYLARPCQYVDAEARGCSQRYWTGQRFAPEVIEASNQALDALKARFSARQLTLVGYSGGGAVATLLAARRNDVRRLITVAGNLDPATWTRYHRIQPLTGSLNPADVRDALNGVRQWHFVGSKDKVIPPSLVESFANHFSKDQRPSVLIEPEYDHACCWVENWPRLLAKTR